MADVANLDELAALYRDLHAHPELAFAEYRTAGIVAERLRGLGYQVTAAVGGTGVVGVLANGDGPTVLLRADMDGLPSNHSPLFAPVIDPTIRTGVTALITAARGWLGTPD